MSLRLFSNLSKNSITRNRSLSHSLSKLQILKGNQILAHVNQFSNIPNVKFDKILNSSNQEIENFQNLPLDKLTENNVLKVKCSTSGEKLLVLNPDFSKLDKIESLSQQLITQLQNVGITSKIQVLENEILDIDKKLVPLEKIYHKINNEALATTDKYLLLFLSSWTAMTMSIARLTWWEYSWDIMEPVAWGVQAGGLLFWGWYYFITKSENTMSDLAYRTHNKKFMSKLEAENFSVEEFNKLINRRKIAEDEIKRIKLE